MCVQNISVFVSKEMLILYKTHLARNCELCQYFGFILNTKTPCNWDFSLKYEFFFLPNSAVKEMSFINCLILSSYSFLVFFYSFIFIRPFVTMDTAWKHWPSVSLLFFPPFNSFSYFRINFLFWSFYRFKKENESIPEGTTVTITAHAHHSWKRHNFFSFPSDWPNNDSFSLFLRFLSL